MEEWAKLSATFLRDSALLKGVEEGIIQSMAANANRVSLKSNHILFQQGDDGDDMFIVYSGTLEVSVMSPDGKKLSLNILKRGELFGEISALDGLSRTATVAAKEDSTLIRFSGSTTREIFASNPDFASHLVNVLCARIRWINQQVEDYFLLTTESRLASRILLLYGKFSDEYGVLHISQSELSEFLGTSRETVNKTLQAWRSSGLIELGRGTLKVIDSSSLRSLISD